MAVVAVVTVVGVLAVVAVLSVVPVVFAAVTERPARGARLEHRPGELVHHVVDTVGRRQTTVRPLLTATRPLLAAVRGLLTAPRVVLARRTAVLAVVSVHLVARVREVEVHPAGEGRAAGRHDGRDEKRRPCGALFAAVRHRGLPDLRLV
ncbi:hypothetical protein ACFXDE_17760 [Kitasatospora sp. NPDC059408]|uniref:hypothetical protein n=1 Tax=Kitasatospora sp. NPDC059408 TaxID=3346823 RepID=UPI00369BBC1E